MFSDDFLQKIEHTKNTKVSGGAYIFGVVCIIIHAWCAATVVVATRFMKEIHFTVVMFHYGLISSLILIIWLIAEYFMY